VKSFGAIHHIDITVRDPDDGSIVDTVPKATREDALDALDTAQEGAAILLSTHHLDTAEELSDRVGILHRGRLVLEGPAAELRERTATADLEEVFLQVTAPDAEPAVR